tara:strand:- start:7818 stop:8024 length:207 start_codon:yes stop_codon:yes gene_type:complete
MKNLQKRERDIVRELTEKELKNLKRKGKRQLTDDDAMQIDRILKYQKKKKSSLTERNRLIKLLKEAQE